MVRDRARARVSVSHFIICLYSCSSAHCIYLFSNRFSAAFHLSLTVHISAVMLSKK